MALLGRYARAALQEAKEEDRKTKEAVARGRSSSLAAGATPAAKKPSVQLGLGKLPAEATPGLFSARGLQLTARKLSKLSGKALGLAGLGPAVSKRGDRSSVVEEAALTKPPTYRGHAQQREQMDMPGKVLPSRRRTHMEELGEGAEGSAPKAASGAEGSSPTAELDARRDSEAARMRRSRMVRDGEESSPMPDPTRMPSPPVAAPAPTAPIAEPPIENVVADGTTAPAALTDASPVEAVVPGESTAGPAAPTAAPPVEAVVPGESTAAPGSANGAEVGPTPDELLVA